MIIEREGNSTIVYQENISLINFIKNLKAAYDKLKNDHIIVNLFSFSTLSSDEILEFLELSNAHKGDKKSFVLVTDKVSYDEVPDEISLVPTIREAMDLIEMEDIERDLEL